MQGRLSRVLMSVHAIRLLELDKYIKLEVTSYLLCYPSRQNGQQCQYPQQIGRPRKRARKPGLYNTWVEQALTVHCYFIFSLLPINARLVGIQNVK
jgi:hypothetical protein